MNKLLAVCALVLVIAVGSCKKDQTDPSKNTPQYCDTTISISYSHSSHYDYTQATFTATASSDFVSYTWNFGDGASSSEQNPVHHYPAAGSYHVTLQGITKCHNIINLDTTIIISSTYTYKWVFSSIQYQLSVAGSSPMMLSDSGYYNDGYGSDMLTGDTSVQNGSHYFFINHNVMSNPAVQFHFYFFAGNPTAWGAPPAGSYGASGSGGTISYGSYLPYYYSDIFGQQYGSVQVSISRSDSVIDGTFNIAAIDDGYGLSTTPTNINISNGSFHVARSRYYY